MKNRGGVELVTGCSSGFKTGSEKLSVLVMYYLTKFDEVI